MEWIRSGTPQEGEKLREFAESCYGTADETPDFVKILPKVYKEPHACAKNHLVLETEEGVKGQLYLGITEWLVDGRRLKMGHIGAVCVASHYRGRGAMKRLMEEARYLLEREGCLIIALSGQRQRYERYGFVPTGQKLEYVFYPENVGERAGEGYQLRPMEPGDLAQVEALHHGYPVHMDRNRETFLDLLNSWEARTFVLTNQKGLCGYCTVFDQEGYGVISELRLQSAEQLKPLCALLFGQGQRALKLCLMPGSPEAAMAERLCERYIIGPDHNYCVLRPDLLAEALLAAKHKERNLPSGRTALMITGYGCFIMEVKEDAVRAGWADPEADDDNQKEGNAKAGQQDPPPIEISYQQAVHILFSPLSQDRNRLAAKEPLLDSWLPLPLCVEQNDCY